MDPSELPKEAETRSVPPHQRDSESQHPPSFERPGDWIGPYKLQKIIGRGGFGVVWLAERQEPMVQRVALKVLHPDMNSESVRARFEQERQALAVMDHPNVAKILDGGETTSGRPYLVMEFVQGEPITQFCDKEKKSIQERLELFISVCEAVQHAHHKGIIHRDLKPSNILVSIKDNRAIPKVIDFGVAKAISRALTDKTIYTEPGQLIGTLEYMSPEQAEMGALDIDTRTDIYSLGVVLYELLVGTPPFDSKMLRAAARAEVFRIIRDVEPPRPSTKLSQADKRTGVEIARARRDDPERLANELMQELEWIPLKAIRKDRVRRYSTPDAMALDLRRYLNGEPLEAAPESWHYYVRKFLVRHRVFIASVGAVLTALLLGTVVSTSLYLKAKASERDATLQAGVANRERLAADVARLDAQTAAARAERLSYSSAVAAAWSALRLGESTECRRHLESVPQHMRGWEWRHLNSVVNRGKVECNLQTPIRSIAIVGDRAIAVGDAEYVQWKRHSADAATSRLNMIEFPNDKAPQPALTIGASDDGSLLLIEQPSSESKQGAVWLARAQPLELLFRVREGLLDNDSRATCFAFSADGRLLAARAMDASASVIRVFDIASGKVQCTLPDAPCMAFAPDAKQLVLGTSDLATYLIPSGQRVRIDGGMTIAGRIERVLCSSDRVVAATSSGVSAWSAINHKALWSVPGQARAWRVSPDGSRLAVAVGSQITLRSAESGIAIIALEGHGDRVAAVAFEPVGDALVSADISGEIRTWKVAPVDRFRTPLAAYRVLPSSDGSLLLIVGRDGTSIPAAYIADANDGRRVCTIAGVEDATWAPDGRSLVVLTSLGVARQVNARTGDVEQDLFQMDELPSTSGSQSIHRAILVCSPTLSLVVSAWSAGSKSRLEVHDIDHNRLVSAVSWSDRDIDQLAWSLGNELAVASTNRIDVLNSSLEPVRAPVDFPGSATALAFGGHHNGLAVGSWDGSVFLLTDRPAVDHLRGAGKSPVLGLAFDYSLDRLMIASGSAVGVWDVANHQILISLEADQRVDAVALERNSATLWGVLQDGDIRAWRASN